MGSFDDRFLRIIGGKPEVVPAVANYLSAVRTGNLLFVSGHGPYKDGSYRYCGKAGGKVSLEDAYQSARLCAINCLIAVRSVIGSLDRVKRIVQVHGFINSEPGFREQPAVLNGASDILVEIFGEQGRHARAAVGISELAFDISVEVEMVVEVATDAGR